MKSGRDGQRERRMDGGEHDQEGTSLHVPQNGKEWRECEEDKTRENGTRRELNDFYNVFRYY